MRSCGERRVSVWCSQAVDTTTNQSSLGLVERYHMSAKLVSFKTPKMLLRASPSLMDDDESDIPRGESTSARAPRGTDDLL